MPEKDKPNLLVIDITSSSQQTDFHRTWKLLNLINEAVNRDYNDTQESDRKSLTSASFPDASSDKTVIIPSAKQKDEDKTYSQLVDEFMTGIKKEEDLHEYNEELGLSMFQFCLLNELFDIAEGIIPTAIATELDPHYLYECATIAHQTYERSSHDKTSNLFDFYLQLDKLQTIAARSALSHRRDPSAIDTEHRQPD